MTERKKSSEASTYSQSTSDGSTRSAKSRAVEGKSTSPVSTPSSIPTETRTLSSESTPNSTCTSATPARSAETLSISPQTITAMQTAITSAHQKRSTKSFDSQEKNSAGWYSDALKQVGNECPISQLLELPPLEDRRLRCLYPYRRTVANFAPLPDMEPELEAEFQRTVLRPSPATPPEMEVELSIRDWINAYRYPERPPLVSFPVDYKAEHSELDSTFHDWGSSEPIGPGPSALRVLLQPLWDLVAHSVWWSLPAAIRRRLE